MTDRGSGLRITALSRGLRGRCPNCGGRGVFRGIADLEEQCPTCGFSFVREEGYWVGAMVVIFGVIIVLYGTWLLGGLLLTWPDVPWNLLMIGGLIIAGISPLVLYGWSKTVWLGIDMTFNPARAEEFRDHPDRG